MSNQKPGNVVELRPTEAQKEEKAQKRKFEKKWGKAVADQKFCMLPSLLIKAQRRLGLSPIQFAVIVHLCDFWWEDGKHPFPKKETIAHRLNVTEKQVQRVMRDLEKAGYVQRIPRSTPHGRTSNEYNLSGLVRKLQELAPEFAEANAAKGRVERRGGLKVKTGGSAK